MTELWWERRVDWREAKSLDGGEFNMAQTDRYVDRPAARGMIYAWI